MVMVYGLRLARAPVDERVQCRDGAGAREDGALAEGAAAAGGRDDREESSGSKPKRVEAGLKRHEVVGASNGFAPTCLERRRPRHIEKRRERKEATEGEADAEAGWE